MSKPHPADKPKSVLAQKTTFYTIHMFSLDVVNQIMPDVDDHRNPKEASRLLGLAYKVMFDWCKNHLWHMGYTRKDVSTHGRMIATLRVHDPMEAFYQVMNSNPLRDLLREWYDYGNPDTDMRAPKR